MCCDYVVSSLSEAYETFSNQRKATQAIFSILVLVPQITALLSDTISVIRKPDAFYVKAPHATWF